MALISCPECGRAVSEKAANCPQCGFPIAAQIGNGTISVKWADSKGTALYGVDVYINGEMIGSIKNAGEVSADLPFGDYKIEVRQNKAVMYQESVKLNENASLVTIPLKLKMGFAHAKFEKAELPQDHVAKCPTCGSTQIKRISSTSRMIGFGMVGFASGKIGKTFECKNCRYRW